MEKSNVITLPIRGKAKEKRKRKIRNVDGIKYFGYTGKKIHPVREVGSNESGQEVPIVPVRNQF